MSDTKHSPLPWKVGDGAVSGWVAITDANNDQIVDVNYSDGMDEPTFFPEQANAELIVRSVNSHDALVEALKDLIRQLPNDERLADFNLDRAEAALAEAEQKTEG